MSSTSPDIRPTASSERIWLGAKEIEGTFFRQHGHRYVCRKIRTWRLLNKMRAIVSLIDRDSRGCSTMMTFLDLGSVISELKVTAQLKRKIQRAQGKHTHGKYSANSGAFCLRVVCPPHPLRGNLTCSIASKAHHLHYQPQIHHVDGLRH